VVLINHYVPHLAPCSFITSTHVDFCLGFVIGRRSDECPPHLRRERIRAEGCIFTK